jgi:hypothetical protein
MARNLLTTELQKEFKTKKEITTAEVRAFYKKYFQEVKDSTVNWKIYHLILQGVLTRKKIGVYQLSK